MKYIGVAVLLTLLFITFGVQTTDAQKRDHLTSQEIELIRDVQDVDLRMQIFVRAIERRLISIDGVSNASAEEKKRIEKETENWGPLPGGSRSALLSDIRGIVNEAIDKFEDVFERDPKNEYLAFGYFIIADYCETLLPRLETFAAQTNDPRDIGSLETAADDCRDILAVKDKFTRPTSKRKKAKQQNY